MTDSTHEREAQHPTMSEKLGTCDKWGEPHERVVIFAPQLDLDVENHYCNWRPLLTLPCS